MSTNSKHGEEIWFYYLLARDMANIGKK